MKRFLMILIASALVTGISACDTDGFRPEEPSARPNDPHTNDTTMTLRIKVGAATFSATLRDNATAKAFGEMLPMTIRMAEMNGNEKYCNLPNSLPTAASNPGTIRNGDIMLYESGTVVLFYKTFRTSFSYTAIGSIDDPAGLESALGRGDATVTFEKVR